MRYLMRLKGVLLKESICVHLGYVFTAGALGLLRGAGGGPCASISCERCPLRRLRAGPEALRMMMMIAEIC